MIELSVADVRRALAAAAGWEEQGSGEAVTPLVGQIFHGVFADLVGSDPQRSGLAVIDGSGPEKEQRVEALVEHTWQKLVAPRLLRHGASLQTASEAVVTLWKAAQVLCAWLTDVALDLPEVRPGSNGSRWEGWAASLQSEAPLACEIRHPSFTEPVRLIGIADSILHVPSRGALCAIELKLGRGSPAVDLGQAALYRLILNKSPGATADAAVALLSFSPTLSERVFQAADLVETEARLIELIGKIAKVRRPDPALLPTPAAPPVASTTEAHAALGRNLVRACRDQGSAIELRGEPVVGPRFLRFEARLATGGRLDNLRRRMPEVAHRLSLERQPIMTLEAGSLYIDVVRPDPQLVPFEGIVAQLAPVDPLVGSGRLPIGVDAGGTLHLTDLASAGRSHVLVAGTTGSGKSEWLRMALAGLLAQNTPDTLRIVTIDPKLNAFGDLERSRFLWKSGSFWIPGTRDATEVFDDLIDEMERRYQLTRETGSEHLAEHVRKTGRPLPRIVCLCDEYMALVSAGKEVRKRLEEQVTLLGAKARAAGIHLVLATQQPSRQVVSGAIQSNLPCRVALTLTSHIESTMILGTAGAERLTLNGDLFYKDFGDPVRLQAPFLLAEERKRRFAG